MDQKRSTKQCQLFHASSNSPTHSTTSKCTHQRRGSACPTVALKWTRTSIYWLRKRSFSSRKRHWAAARAGEADWTAQMSLETDHWEQERGLVSRFFFLNFLKRTTRTPYDWVDPISQTEDILQVFDFANFTILQTGFSLRKTWRNSKTCKISSVCEIENLEKCKVESLGITLRNRTKKLCEIDESSSVNVNHVLDLNFFTQRGKIAGWSPYICHNVIYWRFYKLVELSSNVQKYNVK